MNLSLFDYMKANGIGGVGGMVKDIGVDLSPTEYWAATGRWAQDPNNDPGYRAWVEANVPASFKQTLTDAPKAGPNLVSMGADGNVNIPDSILASNMDKSGFGGFDWGDMAGGFALTLPAVGGIIGAAGAGLGAAGGMGALEAGALAGMPGYGAALGSSLAGAGAAAGIGGGMADWWTELGLTPADVGMEVSPWTTNPGIADLTGGVLTDAGSTAAWTQELSKVPASLATRAAEALKSGSSAKMIADALGISEGAVGLLGKLAATGLGIFGANQQQESQARLAREFAEYGAPYRARLAESYADPAAFLANSPDIKAAVDLGTTATARALSTGGNPTGSGHALTEIQDYATKGLYGRLGQERDRLAGFGGLTAYNAAAPGAAKDATAAESGVPNAIGAGINSITAPIKTTYQTMMDFFNQPGVA